jgi:prepilin-type N-terminal cleavage/methylation domain-containing protein
MNRTVSSSEKSTKTGGFSLVELVIVVLLIAILAMMAIPQIVASRRMARFAGVQKVLVSNLREARQLAMSERTPVTFRYDHATRQAIIFGGSRGVVGNAANRVEQLDGQGLLAGEIAYGKPPGTPNSALGDGTNQTALSASQIVDVTFQPDGAVINASENPQNVGLFFYDATMPGRSAFAVSILGAGGRVKLWRYSQYASSYVE